MRADDHISKIINGAFFKMKIENCWIAVEEHEDFIHAWPIYPREHEQHPLSSAMEIFEHVIQDLNGRMILKDDLNSLYPFVIGIPIDVTTKDINRASKSLMKSYNDYIEYRRENKREEKRIERGEKVISRFNL